MADNSTGRASGFDASSSTDVSGPARLSGKLIAGADLALDVLAESPDCVKVLTPDGVISAINRAGLQHLEYADGHEVANKRWLDFWPEHEKSVVRTAFDEAMAGSGNRFAAQCPTARGTLKWWEVALSPLRNASGVVVGVLAIARDVSGSRWFEDPLRLSEARFRALADNIAQFAWMADGNGHIFWYNKRWYDYTGMTPAEMAGRGWRRAHHPDFVDAVADKISAHFESGEPWEDTFPLRRADGVFRWFLSRALPIRDDTGEVTLWCGTNTDINNERLVAERLALNSRLLEMSHEAILTWSVDGTIISWNKGCQDLYGYSEKEALGRTSHALLSTRHGSSIDAFVDALREKQTWTGELLHRAKDGREVWVESRHELITVAGESIVLETNRDITERRRSDELRRLLLAELDHRVKNTLAIVQAIAAQTARRAPNLGEFTASFNARLQSLARAHNLLVDTQWSGATLRALITNQIEIGTRRTTASACKARMPSSQRKVRCSSA